MLVDAEVQGSPLVFALAWIRPSTERVSWTADDHTHETYYVKNGTLRVTWDGTDAGAATLGPSDSFYFPPGRTYSAENVGDDDVALVWAMTPSPATFAPSPSRGVDRAV
ncbi:MAG: cupin domain-containing protein [Actinobacteria bacterium]|nr:cupin domain-containing protein [Actinomycetota bacterium]